jgi:DUF3054 family protein
VAGSPSIAAATRALRTRLVVADMLGLLAFTLLGLRAHLVGQTGPAVLRTVGPLWAAWILIGVWRGAYRAPSVAALLQTWILAVPVALVARQLILGRPFGPRFLVFVAVALAMTLLCVVVARLIMARPAPGAR